MKQKKRSLLSTIGYGLSSIHSFDKWMLSFAGLLVVLKVAVPFAGVYLPKLVLDMLDSNASAQQMVFKIGGYTLLLAVLHFANSWATRHRAWRSNYVQQHGTRNVFLKYLDCAYSYFENPEKQALYSRLRQNIDMTNGNCYDYLLTALISIISGVLGFILYASILSTLNIGIVLLLTATSLINYYALDAAKKYEHKNKAKWAPLDRKIAYVTATSQNHEYGKDIRLYDMKNWFMSIAHKLLAERSEWDNNVQGKHLTPKLINAVTVLLRDGVAYGLLLYQVTNGNISVADFMLIFGAVAGFSGFVTSIVEHASSFNSAIVYINEMKDYLEDGQDIFPSNPAPLPDVTKPLSIEFRDVTFSYGDNRKVLNRFNLVIAAEEKLAIVGLNGAGKTTLVKLLCGFYTPDEGQILIDGIDISRFEKKQLYSLFSPIFQDFFMLPFTIAENVAPYPEDSKVEDCLKSAGLGEYISSLPKGIHTPISQLAYEDGITLSGGQQQKLFMARALYKNAPILILDEPTSALDPIAESQVYESYLAYSKGKTSVFISHRLASTRFCDRIILMANGQPTEIGTHDELIASGGEYANMYSIQSKYYQEDAMGGDELVLL